MYLYLPGMNNKLLHNQRNKGIIDLIQRSDITAASSPVEAVFR